MQSNLNLKRPAEPTHFDEQENSAPKKFLNVMKQEIEEEGTSEESEGEESVSSEEPNIHVKDESDDDDQEEEQSSSEDDEDDAKIDDHLPQTLKITIQNLTTEQRKIFNYVRKLMNDEQYRKTHQTAILVEGIAGSGKTELLKTLCDYVCHTFKDKPVFVASSGVAALNYHIGRSGHSMFRFPFNVSDSQSSLCEISDYDIDQVTNAPIIVYDEVNMVDKRLIQMLDRTLRKLMRTDKVFGGKNIIFSGDFLQVGPVLNDSADIIKYSLKRSPLWPALKLFSLTIPQRTEKDPEYTRFLIKLSRDYLPPRTIGGDTYVPLKKIEFTIDFENALEFVFPDEILSNPDACARRAVLTSQNDMAKFLNSEILNHLDGEIVSIRAEDTDNFEEILGMQHLPDVLTEDQVIPDRDLKLKKGCICMIIRNTYNPITLLNGAKVIVEDILQDEILIRKPGEQKCYYLGKQSFYVRLGFGNGLCRYQFPVRVCYATSIHKSQGQTLDKAAVDLRNSIFTHGQLFLAMSRVRSRKDIKVLVDADKICDGVAYAPNIVISELI